MIRGERDPGVTRRRLGPRIGALALSLAALGPPPGFAAEIGRLFFTPEERAALERQRQSGKLERRQPQPGSVRVSGVVSRSSGRNTVWLNDVPVRADAGSSGAGVTVRSTAPDTVELRAPSGAPAHLKAGQALDIDSGARYDALAGGRIEISPAAARNP